MPNTDLKIGSLLRIKEYCRKMSPSREQRVASWPSINETHQHDVLFPNGAVHFYVNNWEVVSHAK